MAKLGNLVLYGLVAAMIIGSIAISCAMLVETEALTRAAFMAGRRTAQEWPLCVQDWPEIPKPFEPARVPL